MRRRVASIVCLVAAGLLATIMAAWLVLGVLGNAVGRALAPDASRRLASGLVGAAIASFVWVVLCWIVGFALPGALTKRGYEVSPGP